MIKSNLLFVLVFIQILSVQPVFVMEQALVQKTKSLYQYFNLADCFEHASRDVKSLIVQHIDARNNFGKMWCKSHTIDVDGYVKDIAYNPRGTMLAMATCHAAFLLNFANNKVVKLNNNIEVNAVAFHPNGTMLATASENKIRLLALDGSELSRFSHGKEMITAVAFHPQGNMVATASYDHTAALWNLQNHKYRLLHHNNRVTAVAFHPQCTMVATGSWDFTARLWDCEGVELKRLQHGDVLRAVAFNPQGDMLATSEGDYRVYLWDIGGNKLRELHHGNMANAIAFHPQENIVAIASWDYGAYLWNLDSIEKSTRLQHYDFVNAVAFASNNRMATCSEQYVFTYERHQPTLEQTMLFVVLSDFSKVCMLRRKKMQVTTAQAAELLVFIAQTLKLDHAELQKVWLTMPNEWQTSLVESLVNRINQMANSKKRTKKCHIM
ncbi:MAG: WD40 repeat domain-containing protein [Candidatus Babeliales bacterium]